MPFNPASHVLSPANGDVNGCIAAYLPTTPVNSTVLDFVRDLRELLLELDRVDSKNDMEAESTKARVAGAINEVLEDVESEAEETVGRWMSLQATGTGVMGLEVAGSGDLAIFG